MSRAKFCVAICGGGIGGLCLAVALSRYQGIQVDLYEAAAQFREIGAGVSIWARSWDILTALGLQAKLVDLAHGSPDMSARIQYRKSDQPEEGQRFHSLEPPYSCIHLHRAHFLDVLVDALPEGVAHFGKRLTSYSQGELDSSLQLHFSDGTAATCHVLIGCDGIKSTVRKQIFQEKAVATGQKEFLRYVDPIWTGAVAYRGLIPVDDLKAKAGGEHRAVETPTIYCGKDKHIVSYSVSGGSLVNVAAFSSVPTAESTLYDGDWVVNCTKEELLQCYHGWEPEVVDMLACIEKPTRWAIHHLNPLPMYVSGRVALLGDAAHAMSPYQGAGAGQAIEDAFVLARLLGHPSTTITTLPQALLAYEHVRLPLANHILRSSYQAGMIYRFQSPQGDDVRVLGPAIQHQWSWFTDTTAIGEAERAIDWYTTQ